MSESVTPLTGGRMTPGIVKIADTVRRPATSASPFVAELLALYERALTGRHPVVCHHDPGPNNTVFHESEPVAFIDFDTAASGSPLEDLGYLAWTWCISSRASAPTGEVQAAQVRVLVDAYGPAHAERSAVVDAILERQTRNARFWAEIRSVQASAIATDAQIAERIAWSRREHWHTVINRDAFDAALHDQAR